jgi:hypothetical protein
MGVNVKPENLTDASVVRNKKRSKQDNKELLDLTSQFNAQMQQATNEKVNMEHPLAQMQAQIEDMMGISNNDAAMPNQTASY